MGYFFRAASKDLPYGFENRNKEVILEILKENQEELQTHSDFMKTGGNNQDSQDTSKFSESLNPRMRDIKEEDEEISSMSNSKFDELPKFRKEDFSVETPLKILELNPEMMEEIIKQKTSIIYNAILEKFKAGNPCAIYMEMVLFKYYLQVKVSKESKIRMFKWRQALNRSWTGGDQSVSQDPDGDGRLNWKLLQYFPRCDKGDSI